ncbi:hypothetical protein OHA70_34365 [Kribbella sp. NBC_00382]|uniref:hypothetical protein n=1 Tax=Kribbella sp. NBC_00382 TaxID=2975967 RepID=UPI002E1F53C2
MLGSQTLETGIGLVAMFFIIATAASAITEVGSRLLKKRAKDLEKTIESMLSGKAPIKNSAALESLKKTSVWVAASAAARPRAFKKKAKGPSYLSAKMFADAVTEMLADGPQLTDLTKLPNLDKRLQALVREGRGDLLRLKAGLEAWYDEGMQRLEGNYKRWATTFLFVVGLVIAGVANASTIDVAQDLWQGTATRQAVGEAASKVVKEGADASQLESVATATDKLEELSLPVGWGTEDKATWSADPWPWEWHGSQLATAMGFLLTGLLVMLGGPFWFDLLSRLVTLRSSGTKPPLATDDPTSASGRLSTESVAAAPVRRVVVGPPGAPGGSGVPPDVNAVLAELLGLQLPNSSAGEPDVQNG